MRICVYEEVFFWNRVRMLQVLQAMSNMTLSGFCGGCCFQYKCKVDFLYYLLTSRCCFIHDCRHYP